MNGEFPGGSVSRTWHFHCCGLGSVRGQRPNVLQAAQRGNKTNKTKTHLELVKSPGTELRESWVEALGSVPLPTSMVSLLVSNEPCIFWSLSILKVSLSRYNWHTINYIYLFFYWFFGSIVDVQCCVHFCCTAKRISYIYRYIPSFFRSPLSIEWSSLCCTIGPH